MDLDRQRAWTVIVEKTKSAWGLGRTLLREEGSGHLQQGGHGYTWLEVGDQGAF